VAGRASEGSAVCGEAPPRADPASAASGVSAASRERRGSDGTASAGGRGVWRAHGMDGRGGADGGSAAGRPAARRASDGAGASDRGLGSDGLGSADGDAEGREGVGGFACGPFGRAAPRGDSDADGTSAARPEDGGAGPSEEEGEDGEGVEGVDGNRGHGLGGGGGPDGRDGPDGREEPDGPVGPEGRDGPGAPAAPADPDSPEEPAEAAVPDGPAVPDGLGVPAPGAPAPSQGARWGVRPLRRRTASEAEPEEPRSRSAGEPCGGTLPPGTGGPCAGTRSSIGSDEDGRFPTVPAAEAKRSSRESAATEGPVSPSESSYNCRHQSSS
jgi:hypothetical protein